MNFDFTPDDIFSGTVDYSLEQFLRDLFEQSKQEVDEDLLFIPARDEIERKTLINGRFKQNAETCYAIAVENYTLDRLCRACLRVGSSLDYNSLIQVLRDIEKNNLDNIDILKAIVSKEHLNAQKMGIREEDAHDLIKTEVINIMDMVLKQNGVANFIN